MNKLYLHSLLAVVFFMPLAIFAQDVVRGERPPVDLDKLPADSYIKGRLSIKFKPAAVSFLKAIPEKNNNGLIVFGNSSVDELNRKFAVKDAKRVFETILQDKQYEARHKAWGFHLWYELELPGDVNVIEAIKQYTALGIIEIAEPQYKKILYDNNKKIAWTPADPQFANQWHFNNTGQEGGTVDADIDLPEAWDIQKGNPNVIVAVVDGGVDTTHPDLRANLWIGAGNRFGYNFIINSNLISPYDHGCHTAGTIAAVNNNSIGVSGIAGGNGTAASGVRIMSCQVFSNSATAENSGFANAYIFSADKGAAISQNSWGYDGAPGYYEQSILDAIDYFIQNGGGTVLGGGLVIFSAGNSGLYEQDYPGAYHRVISVAATNNMDQRSDYSTYGQWVDISAPGGEINSNSSRGVLSTVSVANGSYAYYEGTSMAAPHVSGVAALIISQAPGRLSNDDVKSILLTTTDNHYGVNLSFANMLGTGRLNAFNALTKTNQVLVTPVVNTATNFSASSSGCNTVNLAWTKNAANNDVMIAVATDKNDLFGIPSGSYSAGNTIAGGGTVIYKGSGTAFNWTTALLDSVHYYFKIWSVTAANAYSAGKVTFIVKNETQSPVTNFTAVAGDCQASLSWTKSAGCPASEVIVAANTTNIFGIPSGNLVAGSSIPGGGTIVYRGSGLSYNHIGLGDTTSNYYAVWAASSFVYSTVPQIINGGSKSFIPSFTATAVSSSQINLGWTKNSCFSGNVLIAYSASNIFGNPSGAYTAGNSISGGGIVLYAGPLSNFNHTGLAQAAMYHYRIWPIISAGIYGLSKTRSVTTMCGSGILSLPATDNFNSAGYNTCQWDTVFVTQAGGSIRPELSLVTTGAGPVATPAEGNYMVKFNSFDCYTGAQMRLVSKPIATNGSSIDVIYRWYHDNSNYTSSFYDREGIKLQWSADGNTWNTFDTADRKPPAAANTSGWTYKQATLPSAALSNPQIRIGFLFTSRYGNNCYLDSISIFNTKLKLTDGATKAAVSEYTDAAGWTHYNDSEGERLLSIKKNGNNLGYVNQAGFNLVVGGANGFSTITNTGANYATNPGGWRTMNRYYDLDPVTEPTANCNVRFYYTTADSINLKNAALTLNPPIGSVSNSMFTVYKINEIATTYNLNPSSGHTNIPKATAYNLNGFWQYGLGGSPSTSNWAFGNMGGNMRYAEYTVKHFGGGGIGIGGAGQGALPVKWLSFTGKLVNNIAALQWIVSEETNVQDYEVEVSKNNGSFISTATLLPLPARSTNTYQYNYPFAETGTYYFRIKQKDLDGKYSYSIIIKIYYSKNGLIVLSPNPAKEYMEIKGAVDLTGVQLTDVLGKAVRVFAPAANNIYSLQGLSKGIYFVSITTSSGAQTQKLMIE